MPIAYWRWDGRKKGLYCKIRVLITSFKSDFDCSVESEPDSEDSNDENNWRNDYPDESSEVRRVPIFLLTSVFFFMLCPVCVSNTHEMDLSLPFFLL